MSYYNLLPLYVLATLREKSNHPGPEEGGFQITLKLIHTKHQDITHCNIDGNNLKWAIANPKCELYSYNLIKSVYSKCECDFRNRNRNLTLNPFS